MGYIYILSNRHYLDGKLLKIGMTTRVVEKRTSEINQPFGVPPKFEIILKEQTKYPDIAEKIIHLKLRKYRTNRRREFFLITEKDAIRTVKSVCQTLIVKTREKPPQYQVFILLLMVFLLLIW